MNERSLELNSSESQSVSNWWMCMECVKVSWLKSSTTSLGLLGEVVFCFLDFEYWVVLERARVWVCVVSGGSQQSVSRAAWPTPRPSTRGPSEWQGMCVLMMNMGQAIRHTNKSQRNYFWNHPVNSYKHFRFPKNIFGISFLQLFDISGGQKTLFFKKCPNNGLVSEKNTSKNFP